MAEQSPKHNVGLLDSYIRNQTAYLQGSIVQADQKATFLLVILSILIGYLENKQPLISRGIALCKWQRWESLAGAISFAAAVLFILGGCVAGAVVWPRYRKTERSASFVSICAEYEKPEDFAKDLLSLDEEEVLSRQLRSHHYRCGVCLKKWYLLKFAYAFSALGFLLFVFFFVLSVLNEVFRLW